MALILAARIAHVGTFTLFGAVKWIGFVLLLKGGRHNASVRSCIPSLSRILNGRKEKENEWDRNSICCQQQPKNCYP
jgi:hypothetical protein